MCFVPKFIKKLKRKQNQKSYKKQIRYPPSMENEKPSLIFQIEQKLIKNSSNR